MNNTQQSMNLLKLTSEFMARKQDQLSRELGEKYDIPPEEVAGVVQSFLDDSYEPALRLAEKLTGKSGVLLLFIGKTDCRVCERCKPILRDFLSRHEEIEVAKLDYTEPEGLLYHIINSNEGGRLPMIAFIIQGEIRMVFTGECSSAGVYEKFYGGIISELKVRAF
jgi:hypothetical protein